MRSNRMFHWMLLTVFLLFFNRCATTQTAIQTTPAETAAPVAKTSVIQKLSFQEEERYTRILVEASEPLDLPFYKLFTDPLRIAIDIPNVDLTPIKEPLKIDNGTVGEVVATQYDGKGRVEIGLTQMANYNISKEDKILTIDVEKVKQVGEVKEETKEEPTVQTTALASPEPQKEETSPGTPEPAPSTALPMKKAKEVVDFVVEEKPDSVTVRIIADGKIENYNAFKLDGPARLVVDLWGVDTRYPQKSLKAKGPLIRKIRIGRYPDKLRLVFDSAKSQMPPYGIDPGDNQMMVSFGNVPQPSGPQISVGESSAAPTGLAKSGSSKPAVLTSIDFKQLDHKSRIAVGATEETQYESQMVSNNLLVVDLKNASVPRHLQRGLDTGEFESAVDYVSLQNVRVGKTSDIRISLRLKEPVPYEITREGKTLFIDLERPKTLVAKKEAIPAKTPRAEEMKAEEKPVSGEPRAEQEASAVESKAGEKPAEAVAPEKYYVGQKVSFDFKDADIKNILRLIAEVSNLNIIAGEDVTGKITMRLVDVPWDQALDVVLQSRSLGMSRSGNIIRVAPMDTLKKELQGELEAKRAKEKLEDLEVELIPVSYAAGESMILPLKTVLSDRGVVTVDLRTNTLVVKDIPKNLTTAKDLVKSLDTKTPQVLIEARIIEANLTFQRELGVSWGFKVVAGSENDSQGTVQGGVNSSAGSPSGTRVVDLPAIARAGAGGGLGTAGILEFLFTSVHGLRELDIAISAHENQGDVRVISSPKIATLDNREASIEQGLRIPYLKLTTEGTVTTDFIDANLKLTVTPHVTNDGNILMKIDVKKDAPDRTVVVQGVPSIDKKQAITQALIRDNGVVVIAGIYTITKNNGYEGIPLFSKIPLLGWLFKTEAKEDERKDLLIFISPKILKDQV